MDIEGIISGAVRSTYQKSRIDGICAEIGLKSIAPLWGEDQMVLMEELISKGFEVIFIGVYAYGLGRNWLGRRLDRQTLNDLIELNRKYGISLIGEGGEYETLVLDAPYFKKRIKLLRHKIIWEGESGYLLVDEAELERK